MWSMMIQYGPKKVYAQAVETIAPLVLSRLAGPIEVDGFVNDPAWAEIDSLPVVMYSPVFMGVLPRFVWN